MKELNVALGMEWLLDVIGGLNYGFSSGHSLKFSNYYKSNYPAWTDGIQDVRVHSKVSAYPNEA